MKHIDVGKCNLKQRHDGVSEFFRCESDYVMLAKDRKDKATQFDLNLMCVLVCDCNETMHPGCCTIPDVDYNSKCCLFDGHDTTGATGAPMKKHLCEACRVHYIENF